MQAVTECYCFVLQTYQVKNLSTCRHPQSNSCIAKK